MSITISIRSSESGKPQPKPGMAGAFGATEPEGSLDNSVEITIDEGHQVSDLEQVLNAGAKAATTTFAVSFPQRGIIEYVGEDQPDEDEMEFLGDPHICGPDCGSGVVVESIVIENPVGPEDLIAKLTESIKRAREFRAKRDAENSTEIKSDEDQ